MRMKDSNASISARLQECVEHGARLIRRRKEFACVFAFEFNTERFKERDHIAHGKLLQDFANLRRRGTCVITLAHLKVRDIASTTTSDRSLMTDGF